MRKVGQDRAAWTSSPPEPNVARELERLRDEDSVLEVTASGGGGTFEVTGAIPEFTGVPAGLQQFYVAPLVTDGAVNMTDTAQLYFTTGGVVASGLWNLALSQDTGNTFGAGTAAIIGTRTTLLDACVYNFASNSFGSTSLGGPFFSDIRTGPNFSVAYRVGGGTPIVIQNGVKTSITMQKHSSTPSGHSLADVGISEDGLNLCCLWASTVSGNQAFISINSIDGTALAGYSTTKLFNDDSSSSISYDHTMIDNGWVVFTADNELVACKATATLQGLKSITTDNPLTRTISNNVSDDGHIFYTLDATDDLYKANLNSGVVSVYPEVFARYVGGSPTKTHDILCYSMHAISANKVVFGGQYAPQAGQPDAGTFYPIYCAVLIDGGNANVSDSIFTTYSTTSSGTTFVYALTSLTNGDVVYAILTPSPYDDFLVKVTGP